MNLNLDSTWSVLQNNFTQRMLGVWLASDKSQGGEKDHRIMCGFFVSTPVYGQAVWAFFGTAVSSLTTVRQPEQSLLSNIGVLVAGSKNLVKETKMNDYRCGFGKDSYYSTPAPLAFRPSIEHLCEKHAIYWLLTTLSLDGHDVRLAWHELNAYRKLAKAFKKVGVK